MTKPVGEFCYLCATPLSDKPTNVEHVVPRALFGQGKKTKSLIELPAHVECNSAFSKDDEVFRLYMTAAAGPDQPNVPKVWAKAMKGFHRPDRPGLKKSILRDIMPFEVQTQAGIYIGKREVMLQDATRIQNVVTRIIRGIHADETGYVLDLDYPVTAELMPSRETGTLLQELAVPMRELAQGEFAYFREKLRGDDESEAFYWLVFYGAIHFWGSTGVRARQNLERLWQEAERNR
jgi:hypothetical protein